MEIDTVRQKIDRLDARLVELLNQRLASPPRSAG